jgi:hypothetical protein
LYSETTGKTTVQHNYDMARSSLVQPGNRGAREAIEITAYKINSWLDSSDGRSVVETGAADSDYLNNTLRCAMDYTSWSCFWFALGPGPDGTGGQGVTPDTMGAGEILRDNFHSTTGPWDLKTTLREEMGLVGDGAESNKWLRLDETTSMYYDTFGDFAYGVIMSRFGVDKDVAIKASQWGDESVTGKHDPNDDLAIELGYQFAADHPDAFDADDVYSFLTSDEALQALEDAGKVRSTALGGSG